MASTSVASVASEDAGTRAADVELDDVTNRDHDVTDTHNHDVTTHDREDGTNYDDGAHNPDDSTDMRDDGTKHDDGVHNPDDSTDMRDDGTNHDDGTHSPDDRGHPVIYTGRDNEYTTFEWIPSVKMYIKRFKRKWLEDNTFILWSLEHCSVEGTTFWATAIGIIKARLGLAKFCFNE